MSSLPAHAAQEQALRELVEVLHAEGTILRGDREHAGRPGRGTVRPDGPSRAWLELEGQFLGAWKYKLAYNLADSGRDGFQDALLDYTGFDDTTLRMGHFKEPLGMELLAASNNLTFMERALPTVLLPSRSLGAWELAVRLSRLDLTDNLGGPGEVVGGEEYNLTVGANWYPNDNSRLMLNWVKVLDLDRPGNALHGTEPSIFMLRGQVNW